jgi:hypothetical protein
LHKKKKKGNFMSEESDEAGDAKEEATRITSPVPSAVIDNGRVFPKTIHQLLSGNDITTEELFAVSSAMEWLPHGKGFRVLRWDDLSSKVLPVHFPDLCDGKEGSDEQWVDAFLLQISSWGFTEVKSGRDRGSFRHEVRCLTDGFLRPRLRHHKSIISFSCNLPLLLFNNSSSSEMHRSYATK